MNSVSLRGRLYSALRVALGLQSRDERLLSGRLIVAFHGVYPSLRGDGLDTVALDVATFRSHLDQLQSLGRIVPLCALLSTAQAPAERPMIALTFDDALQVHTTLVADMLRARRLPWSLAVPAGLVGTNRAIWSSELRLLLKLCASTGRVPALHGETISTKSFTPQELGDFIRRTHRNLIFRASPAESDRYLNSLIDIVGSDRFLSALAADDRLRLASWDELRQLQRDGVEILSHGWRHRPCNHLLDAESLETEVLHSKSTIQRELGCAVEGFVYPHGLHDMAVEPTVNQHYRFSLTTEPRWLPSVQAAGSLPRVDAEYSTNVFRRHIVNCWRRAAL